MKNSIKETMEQLQLMLKARKEHKRIIECTGGKCVNCNPDIKALTQSIEILSEYEKILKENEELKNEYYSLINKIENKIDKFDYEFEKAKRKNYRERADYYWDLIINLKKLLESEE